MLSKLFQLSVRSRMLNAIGSMLFGSPKSHNLPSDFYYLPQDRHTADFTRPGSDNTERQMRRVYANQIRRALNIRAAWAGLFLNVVILPIAVVFVLANSDFTSTKNALTGAAAAGSMVLPKSMRPEFAPSSSAPSQAEIAAAEARVDSLIVRDAQTTPRDEVCRRLTSTLRVARNDTQPTAPYIAARIEHHMNQLCGGN